MSDDFTPSPRASKRRRIATYKSGRSIVNVGEEQDGAGQVTTKRSTPKRGTSRRKQPEDSEEHGGPVADGGSSNEEVQTYETQLPGEELDRDVTPIEDVTATPGHDEDSESAVQPRSSGRERRKPRKYDISPEKPKSIRKSGSGGLKTNSVETQQIQAKDVPVLKGILTPSKRRQARPSKSVGFDTTTDKSMEEQFGFKDIDDSTPVQRAKLSTPKKTSKTPEKQVNGLKSRRKPSTSTTEDIPLPSSAQAAVTISNEKSPEDEDDIGFDQLLEAQQVTNESPLYTTKPVEGLSLQDDPAMLSVKTTVLSRILTSSSAVRASIPDYLQSAYRSIHNLLTATITTGESNSMLILGSRGSGKSLLLNTAIDNLNKKHSHDFHVVRLNGFLQTDDKLALREIWRQLGREMNANSEEMDKTGSYADTMASLLALLSHPEEISGMAPEDTISLTEPSDTGSGMSKISKSIVFVLDEFDLFTTHPRQTLLYNLFDIAQSRKAPIAVIGCSTRMDVVECLEKRVKSRFSHRWVHVPTAKSLEGFGQIVKKALQVATIEAETDGTLDPADLHARESWNVYIEKVFLPSQPVQTVLQHTFFSSKSVPDVLVALYLSVAVLQIPPQPLLLTTGSSENKRLTTTLSSSSSSSLSAQHVVMLLPSLPTLQLSLLVVAARLDTIHNLSAVNFNLVYHHYSELVARSKLQQTASGAIAVGAGVRQWTREMAQEGWEDLGSWSLIVPAQGLVGAAGGRDVGGPEALGGEGASVRMWKADVALDDLAWALREKLDHGGGAAGAAEVLLKWCKEI